MTHSRSYIPNNHFAWISCYYLVIKQIRITAISSDPHSYGPKVMLAVGKPLHMVEKDLTGVGLFPRKLRSAFSPNK
jgi:hypothetical protein